MKYTIISLLALVFGLIYLNSILSQDLTRQKPIEKTILFKGENGSLHFYEPSELSLKTGKLYKLILKNKSNSKHYFSSVQFSKAIFTRKIQILSNGKKLAEIKGIIDEVEIWPNHQIEWWFVPIKTGYFKDLFCKVKDKKTGKSHADMGMRGTILIE